jgi:hypothetical protein
MTQGVSIGSGGGYGGSSYGGGYGGYSSGGGLTRGISVGTGGGYGYSGGYGSGYGLQTTNYGLSSGVSVGTGGYYGNGYGNNSQYPWQETLPPLSFTPGVCVTPQEAHTGPCTGSQQMWAGGSPSIGSDSMYRSSNPYYSTTMNDPFEKYTSKFSQQDSGLKKYTPSYLHEGQLSLSSLPYTGIDSDWATYLMYVLAFATGVGLIVRSMVHYAENAYA